jgi:FKBP-type peptidyl-prolyl cis-trans isomerase FkpA
LNKIVFFYLVVLVAVTSCAGNRPPSDPKKQALKDDSLIKTYLKTNRVAAVKDSSSGLYYQIISPGAGANPTANSTVQVNYTGKLLNGETFDASPAGKPISFPLNAVIKGWTLGIPLIKPGGTIFLIIPSGLGYGDYGSGPIPPNAVLTFKVDLLHVQ